MRKIVCLIFMLALLCVATIVQAATVTNARWGQQDNDGLRFVMDLSADCRYELKLEGNTLVLTVEAEPADGVAKSYAIGRKLADSMLVAKDGGKTILKAELKQSITKEEYRCFALKQPARIVVDVIPKAANKTVLPSYVNKTLPANTAPVTTAPAPKTDAPVVSNQPQKAANNGTTWTPANPSTNGSWTDRFHKNDKQTDKQTLTPSQRVKQSIEEARGIQKPATEGVNTQLPAKQTTETVKPQPATQVGTVVNKPEANPISTQEKVAQQQTSLKKLLTAKQNARREAAAEYNSKKKVTKNKDGTTVKVEDGITYIKGSGKFDVDGGLKDKVIAIDPGHGGSDPGAIGAGGNQEKNITLPISKMLKELLTKAGAKVYLTRTGDTDVAKPGASDKEELQARVNVAEKYNADAFISIHINSAANKSIGGFASYYYPKTKHDARLAKAIQSKLTKNFGLQDLGIREANFYVNKRSSMPSTLLELGFISNAKEESVLKSKWFQEKAAKMIFEGIKDYFK